MTGKQLFDTIQQEADKTPLGSPERQYAQVLRSCNRVINRENLYWLLEEAEEKGMKIRLTYPFNPDLGPSEPNGVELY